MLSVRSHSFCQSGLPSRSCARVLCHTPISGETPSVTMASTRPLGSASMKANSVIATCTGPGSPARSTVRMLSSLPPGAMTTAELRWKVSVAGWPGCSACMRWK